MSVKWTPDEIANLKRLGAKGLTANEIAMEIGRAPKAVREMARKLGISYVPAKPHNQWTEAEISTLVRMTEAGRAVWEISKEIGRTSGSVTEMRRIIGARMSPQVAAAAAARRQHAGMAHVSRPYTRAELAWAAARISERAGDPQALMIAGLHTGLPWRVFEDVNIEDARRARQRVVGSEVVR